MSEADKRWTKTGLDCLSRNADCGSCTMYRVHGFHKAAQGWKQCHQPQENENLFLMGIKPPKSYKPITQPQ